MFEFLLSNGISDRNKLKENWFIKNKPELYKEILKFKKSLNTDTTQKFSQILYHFKMNWIEYPICEWCQNPNKRFIGFDTGYMKGCNKHCAIQLSRPQGIETRKNNTLEKHGVKHTTQLKSVQDKMKKTNLEKYGVEFAAQNNDIKQKMYNIMGEKYGCKTPLQNEEIKDKMMLQIIEKHKHHDNIMFVNYTNKIYTFLCKKCFKEFNIESGLLSSRLYKYIDLCLNCNPMGNNTSQGHREIVQYLKTLDIELDLELNNRRVISPKELDIFIFNKNIGIEYNSIYYHASEENDYSYSGKERDYHMDKKKMCLEKNIDLIHIWEDDWELKKDLVKSIINNRFGLTTKIGARKCILKEVNKQESKEFLEQNHIQGDCIESKRYGLYYNNELVSLATFKLIKKDTNIYELKRFCNKQGTSVIGGLSRLFKHFIKQENPLEIISYCDNDYFKGDIYHSIGMTLVEDFIPNYWWSNKKVREDRRNFTKKNLVSMGEDINLTETEIMFNKNYLKCYGSGNKKFIWKK